MTLAAMERGLSWAIACDEKMDVRILSSLEGAVEIFVWFSRALKTANESSQCDAASLSAHAKPLCYHVDTE
jgi:hypothetical protein